MYRCAIYYMYDTSLNDISANVISLSDTKKGRIIMDKYTPLTEAIFYILLAVRKPNHGYGIIQDVEMLTNGRVSLGPGTLYGAIQSLVKKNWIEIYSEETASRKKKQYVITDEGRSAFDIERKRLEELLENAKNMEEK